MKDSATAILTFRYRGQVRDSWRVQCLAHETDEDYWRGHLARYFPEAEFVSVRVEPDEDNAPGPSVAPGDGGG